MDVAVADRRLADVRAWWRVRHPPPSLAQQLDVAYTTVLVTAIFGAVAYGTAGSALAEVLSPERLERYGPLAALVALVLVARWGAFQGPVVFTVPDVGFLLGAPLSRRGLAERRLALAFICGAAAGALLAGVLLVGLGEITGTGDAGHARRGAGGARRTRCCGSVGGRAIGTPRSVPYGFATWPTFDSRGRPRRLVARVPTVPALALLSVVTLGSRSSRRSAPPGHCSAERHLRRAEARQGAIASLGVYDLRTARRSLDAARPRHPPTPGRRADATPARCRPSPGGSPGRAARTGAGWQRRWSSPPALRRHRDRRGGPAARHGRGQWSPATSAPRACCGRSAPSSTSPTAPASCSDPRIGRVLLEHLIVPASVTVNRRGGQETAAALPRRPPERDRRRGHDRGGPRVDALCRDVRAPWRAACRRACSSPRLPPTRREAVSAMVSWLTWWPSVAVVAGIAPLALAEAGAPAPSRRLAGGARRRG